MHTDIHADTAQVARRAKKASARAARSRSLATGVAAIAIAGLFGLAWQLGWVFGTKPGHVIDATAPKVTATPSAYSNEVTGIDSKNLPFKIKATRAEQDKTEQKTVNLETVTGSFARTETESINVKSDRGQFQTKTKQLDLDGGVVITNSAGMTATMDKATVDVTTRKLESRSPVKVLMDGNEITADALVVDNNGEKIKFKGRVKASFGGEQK